MPIQPCLCFISILVLGVIILECVLIDGLLDVRYRRFPFITVIIAQYQAVIPKSQINSVILLDLKQLYRWLTDVSCL